MSREIKFRMWDKACNEMILPDHRKSFKLYLNGCCAIENCGWVTNDMVLQQFIGLQDKSGKDIYLNDIMQFDNGDRLEVDAEDWLGFFARWIGEPECEDQARDPYRISRAEIIGNRFENPGLLTETGEK